MVNASDRLPGFRLPASLLGPAIEAQPLVALLQTIAAAVPTEPGDDFRRTAAARAPTQPRGELPVIDPAQARALRSEISARAAAQPTADMRRAAVARPMPTDPMTPPAPDGLTVGDRGRAVKKAEQMLKRAGFNPGKVDGVFDANTARAVKRFQAATQTNPATVPSGVIDDRTQDRLSAVNKRIERSDGKVIGAGQHNKRTLQAERELRRLGYDTGAVDGTFDRQTGRAMQAFRKDQGKKAGAPVMGKPTEKMLHDEVAALRHDPRRARVKPSKERRQMDARVAAAAGKEHRDGTVGIGEGSSRSKVVKTVQEHLRAAGYSPKRTDGVFDERTRGALEQFQRRSDLPVTGRVDERTWNKLKNATMEAKDGFSPTQREGERSAAVLRSERQLKKLGYNPGKVDGLYTDATQRAVDKFRDKKHLGGEGHGIGPRVHKAMVKALEAQREAKGSALGKRLAKAGMEVARSMGGYNSQGLCATGVSRAVAKAMGFYVGGNGNQIDNNLPRSRFKQVHMSLADALKTPGLILTWERTSSTLGQRYGHTAITMGDGHTSVSDFIETNTLAAGGRSGLKIFRPIK